MYVVTIVELGSALYCPMVTMAPMSPRQVKVGTPTPNLPTKIIPTKIA